MVRRAHHERVNYFGRVIVRIRRGRLAPSFVEEKPPFALSLSKGLAWFDELTTNGPEDGSTGLPRTGQLLWPRDCPGPPRKAGPFFDEEKPPFALSLSKGRVWFDKLTKNGRKMGRKSRHDRTGR